MLDRLSRFDAGADLRRRNSQGESNEVSAAERRWQGRFCLARTRNDQKLNQPSEFSSVPPFGQLRDVVATNQVEKLGARKAIQVNPNRINCVGNTSTPDFLIIQLAPGFPSQRKAQQTQSRFRGGGWLGRFKGRLGSGDEEQPFQRQFLARGLGHEQVAEVHRVKGAAK